MRVITDPITDSVLFLVGTVVVPATVRIVGALLRIVFRPVMSWASKWLDNGLVDDYSLVAASLVRF